MRREETANKHAIDMAETCLNAQPFLAAQRIALSNSIRPDQKRGGAGFGSVERRGVVEKTPEIAIEPHFIGENELSAYAQPP